MPINRVSINSVSVNTVSVNTAVDLMHATVEAHGDREAIVDGRIPPGSQLREIRLAETTPETDRPERAADSLVIHRPSLSKAAYLAVNPLSRQSCVGRT